MNILLIKKEDYLNVFYKIDNFLELAANYSFGRFGANHIKDNLLLKNQQLWIAFDKTDVYGFVVTEVVKYPKITALVMHFTAGKKLSKWKDKMLSELKDFAKQKECKTI